MQRDRRPYAGRAEGRQGKKVITRRGRTEKHHARLFAALIERCRLDI
jgi:hypothetical protein